MAEGNYSDFVTCPNGHKYLKKLGQCPFCPSDGANITKTALYGPDGGIGIDNDPPTKQGGYGGGVVNKPTTPYTDNPPSVKSFDKTGFIEDTIGEGGAIQPGVRVSKKLVGVLYSTSLNAMGVLFNIYEGKNPIGRYGNNSIVIASDNTVSGNHAVILYREGRFSIKDSESQGGTFVNDQFTDFDNVYLNDGDVIRLGRTYFLFRSFVGSFNLHQQNYSNSNQQQNTPNPNTTAEYRTDNDTRTRSY